MQRELEKKLASLVGKELKNEEDSVRMLVQELLKHCLAKQDIASMTNAVKSKMDDEIEKLYNTGLLDYDADDEKYDI